MRYIFLIAKKHLTKRCHSGFISFNFAISVLGVAVGVMALIVVLSVMSGFDRELKAKIVGVQPHLMVEQVGGIDDYIWTTQEIRNFNLPGASSVSPFVQGQAIIRSDTFASGVIVRGVDPTTDHLSFLRKNLRYGEINFDDVSTKDKNWIGQEKVESMGRVLIGEELARVLNVDVGDVVSIISPAMDERSLTAILKKPKMVPFVVSGIFHLGMSDFDSTIAVVGLAQAQQLYRLDERVTGISIRLDDVERAEELKSEIQSRFDSTYIVRSWVDLNRNFFAALKVEKAVMTILLSLIILVAAFNIVSSLTMVVMEKTRDIGILRAVGSTSGGISLIFLLEGFIIGFVGVILGAISGLLLAFHLNAVHDFIERTTGLSVFPKDIYFFDRIPVEINMPDVCLIVFFALIMSLVAGLYPAWQAARLKPVEALRYG